MGRVLLFTEEPVLARGFMSILASDPVFELDSICDNVINLVELIQIRKPEIVLMDFTPEENFSTLLEIRSRVPHCKTVLWIHRISIELAYQAMKLGVRGILRKTLGADLLVKCLERVGAGELWFEKELTAGFLKARTIDLTPREGQLVTLISQGLKNKEIATALSISEATVRIYLSSLFRKVGVKDRYELAIYGLKNMGNGQSAWDEGADQPGLAGEARGRPSQPLRFLLLEKDRPETRADEGVSRRGPGRQGFPAPENSADGQKFRDFSGRKAVSL